MVTADVQQQEVMLRQAVQSDPSNSQAVRDWCNALLAIGDVRSGVPLLKTAIHAGVRDPSARFCLALAHQTDGRFDEAHSILDELLVEQPGLDLVVHLKVRMLAMAGRHAEGLTLVEPHLQDSSPLIACAFGIVAAALGREQEAAERLAQTLNNESATPAIRCDAGLMLARLLDSQGDHDAAMTAARTANVLGAPRYDPKRLQSGFEQRIQQYTDQHVRRLKLATGDTSRPIYILGVPRSGTSLVEAMLGEHAMVGSLGECLVVEQLPSVDLARQQSVQQGSRQLLDAYHALDNEHARVTDKQLGNCGHLATIRSLVPGARIIWCRRDPRDVTLSCYFHYFQYGASWSFDLVHIAHYQQFYDRLMEHWEDVLTMSILRVQYEDLIADAGEQLERMLQYLDLEWDQRCLEFNKSPRVTLTASNEQVKQQLYGSSVGRWRNYESHLPQ